MSPSPGPATTVDQQLGEGADERLAVLLDEYLAALEAGTPLDLDALADAHPELSADLREFAAGIEQLHQATQGIAMPEAEQRAGGMASLKKRLGDYRIVRELGRGGMGVVYEAEQISLARCVALKVLPFAAMWDRKQLTRFQNEARAAAQLHHAHIVPVFGVGQDRGVHFYAMQLVQGQSLDRLLAELRRDDPRGHAETAGPGGTTAADADALPSAVSATGLEVVRRGRRRDYFRAVADMGSHAADALQYAHDCGVIHRDVKPSNLLLDDRNHVWITDFGLARVQGDPSVTATGDVVGTLRYMSPEQAVGQQALVDARTDVYSLGATLYELLALEPAFPGDDRRAVAQAVISQEPRPLRQLAPETPVDLETIVMQALAKSREDRYLTAGELADDLRRFLANQPTRARRPTPVDRVAKLVKRHRLAAGLLAGAVAVVAVLSTVGAVMLSREQARTAAALADAQDNLQRARRVVDRFGGQLVLELERLPGSEPLRRTVLADTLDYYQEFIAQASGDPELAVDLATTQYQAGMIAERMGDAKAAEDYLKAAGVAFERLAAVGRDRDAHLQRQAACWNSLGLLYAERGDDELARAEFDRALEVHRMLSADSPAPAAVSPSESRQFAKILANRGMLAQRRGERAAAENDLAQAIAVLQGVVAAEPGLAAARFDLALALNNRSFLQQRDDPSGARTSCELAAKLLRELVGDESDAATNSTHAADLALTLNNLGALRGRLQDEEAGLRDLTEAAEIQAALHRRAPAVVQHRSDLAVTYNNLGQAAARAGDEKRSANAFAKAVALLTDLAGDYPGEPRFASALAGVINNQAMAAERAGDTATALAQYEAAIARQRTAWTESGGRQRYRGYLGKHYANYVRCLRAAGRSADAASALLELARLWEGNGPQLYETALTMADTAAELARDAAADEGVPNEDSLLTAAAATLEAALQAWSSDDGLLPTTELPEPLQSRLRAATLAQLGGVQ